MTLYPARFPLLNPVRFPVGSTYWADDIPSFEVATTYINPWQQGDTIRFQVDILTSLINVSLATIKLRECSFHQVVDTFTPECAYADGSYICVVVSCQMPAVTGQHYIDIELPFLSGGITLHRYSEMIDIRAVQPLSALIEYTNSGIDHDVFFLDHSGTPTPFYYRVFGGFRSVDDMPGSTSNIFVDQPNSFTALSGTAFNLRKFTLGGGQGVPNYIAGLVNRIIFCCDSLKINDQTYCRTEASAWEKADSSDRFPKSIYRIELAESPNAESEVLSYMPTVTSGTLAATLGTFEADDITQGIVSVTTSAIANPLQAIIYPDVTNYQTQMVLMLPQSTTQFDLTVGKLPTGTYNFVILHVNP